MWTEKYFFIYIESHDQQAYNLSKIHKNDSFSLYRFRIETFLFK